MKCTDQFQAIKSEVQQCNNLYPIIYNPIMFTVLWIYFSDVELYYCVIKKESNILPSIQKNSEMLLLFIFYLSYNN